jgi:hypothetical protein
MQAERLTSRAFESMRAVLAISLPTMGSDGDVMGEHRSALRMASTLGRAGVESYA